MPPAPGFMNPVLALLFCAVSASAFGAQAAADYSAVNRAGEQRMLSQRIVKAYGQIALGTMTRQAAEQLSDSLRRFEENIAALASAASRSEEATRARDSLLQAWAPLRAKVFEPATPESAWVLARMSDEVLARAERLVQALEPEPGAASAVSIAGRQRMLSQRVAKAYVLIALGLDTEQIRDELRGAARLFDAGLELLGARPETSPEIRREIEELSLQWEWLRNAIAIDGAVSYGLIVAESAEAILEIAERITTLYERAASADMARLRKVKDPS
jgi:hypothetical protein